MQVIKSGVVVDDAWQEVPDDVSLPTGGDIILSWQRWQSERASLAQHDGRLGVRIAGNLDVSDLAQDLDRFALIALEFAKLGDGRGFSQARLLRERHRYRGELRAVGYVVRDLLLFMQRCGIDSYVLQAGQDPVAALPAFEELTVKYQTAADGVMPIYHQRR